jgi:acyl carrier protein
MSTIDTLREILHANFDIAPERLEPDTPLADLQIDSLAVIEVLFAVEEKFGVTVPSAPASSQQSLRTFGDIVAYVDALIAEQRPAAKQ